MIQRSQSKKMSEEIADSSLSNLIGLEAPQSFGSILVNDPPISSPKSSSSLSTQVHSLSNKSLTNYRHLRVPKVQELERQYWKRKSNLVLSLMH